MNLASHPTWMELDRSAIAHNLGEVRKRVRPDVRIIASVKANAYGHGIVPIAQVLAEAGADMLATGSFAEAVALRQGGVETPLLLLAGTLAEGMAAVIEQGFIPTLYDKAGAEAASEAASDPTAVFVKVDCGLGRLGVGLDGAEDFLREVAALPNLMLQGLYTHLSFQDAAGMAYTKERLEGFYALLATLKQSGIEIPITQALASSALLMGWQDDCNAVCPGHILYGLNPVSGDLSGIAPFRPALGAIKSQVIQIRDHGDGPEPGSGGYHKNRRQRRTAVAPCGLNDGYVPPRAGQDAVVMFRGREVRVIGVSLEHLTVELPDDVDAAIGDELLIAGGDGAVAVECLAAWQGRRPIDVMMSFSARMPVFTV